MKRFVVDVGIGFLVVVLVMITAAMTPWPTASVRWPDAAEVARLVNLEFLFCAIPAFVITAILALAVKVRSLREGMRRGVAWAGVLTVSLLIMGIVNADLGTLFGSIGLYVWVAATALGPIAVGAIRRTSVPVSAQQVRDEEGSRR